jgi:lipopolysaccharide/colanic/teichoic acid biosynthesis glycosyltransferase
MSEFREIIKKEVYRPSMVSVVIDLLIMLLALVVVLAWFPLGEDDPQEKYYDAALIYGVLWFALSYIIGRYRPLHWQNYLAASFKIFYISLFNLVILSFVSYRFFDGFYSQYVIFTYTAVLFIINFAFISLYFALIYAVDYDEGRLTPDVKRENAVLKPTKRLDNEEFETLCDKIEDYSGRKVLSLLSAKIDIGSGNTYINFSTITTDIENFENYIYYTIVHLPGLNSHRGINLLFRTVNQKLPDDGVFVCCFESKSTRKRKILEKYPPGINYIFYVVNYLFRRLMPKIFITRRLYYDITGGKKRILSKTEVLGRLYYAGFEVIAEKKVNDLNYFFARRKKQPEPELQRNYGSMIRLRRMGKNGQMIEVYKMRTMHPYSEYIQAYIYERNSLSDGGKFKRDIRITTAGRFMRKYWLDELPMIFNLLAGDMKLVGVRPLSAHYFSLYSKELQRKRTKFKPGLLPPFYVDLPKTLDEIQASEMKYLTECEKNGTFITDIKYFFLILKNILFKHAHSA